MVCMDSTGLCCIIYSLQSQKAAPSAAEVYEGIQAHGDDGWLQESVYQECHAYTVHLPQAGRTVCPSSKEKAITLLCKFVGQISDLVLIAKTSLQLRK